MAYNSIQKEYLVVWYGIDNTGALVSNEVEIFGQRLSATGAEVGANDFRISDAGPDGNPNYIAGFPAVAHNSTNNEYLVVWYGTDDTGTLVDGEGEIFGQRLSAAGVEIGANDFQISDVGPDRNPNYGAFDPKVTYNSVDNEYLVVWWGNDDSDGLVVSEAEVFGQRLSATGAEIGLNDFRISDAGPDGNPNYIAWFPAVTHSSTNNEYLIVWYGVDNTGTLVNGEGEIFGQRLAFEPQSVDPNQWVFLPIVIKN